MGAIQNSINQAMAAAAVSGRLIKSQQAQDINAGIAAQEELPKISAQEDELLKEGMEKMDAALAAERNYKELQEIKPSDDASKEDLRAYGELHSEALNDLYAAKRAYNQLQDKQKAIAQRRERAERAIKKAKNWGGNL